MGLFSRGKEVLKSRCTLSTFHDFEALSKTRGRETLARDLGLLDVIALGLGTMLGVSIFVLSPGAVRMAGGSALVALFLGSLVVLVSGLAYAELASTHGKGGRAYVWVRDSLPPPSGFLSAWLTWGGLTAIGSLSAVAIGSFMDFVMGSGGGADAIICLTVGA